MLEILSEDNEVSFDNNLCLITGKSLLLKEGSIREAQAFRNKMQKSESYQDFQNLMIGIVILTIFAALLI